MNLLPNNLGTLANVCAKDNTKYAMNGVHLRVHDDNTYRACSTDTKVGLMVTGPCGVADNYPNIPALESAPNGATESLIPAKSWKNSFAAAKKIKTGFKPILQSVATVIGEKVTSLASTNLEAVTFEQPRNIEGRFPPLADVIPNAEKAKSTVAIDADKLKDLLTALVPFTCGEYNRIDLEIHGNEKVNTMLVLRTKNDQGQEAVALQMVLT